MSEHTGIEDEDLPEDLRPTEDNPLAAGPGESELPDDLDVLGGKDPEESGETEQSGDSEGS